MAEHRPSKPGVVGSSPTSCKLFFVYFFLRNTESRHIVRGNCHFQGIMPSKNVIVIVDRSHEDDIDKHIECLGNPVLYEMSITDVSSARSSTKNENYPQFCQQRVSNFKTQATKATILCEGLPSKEVKQQYDHFFFNGRFLNVDVLLVLNYMMDMPTRYRGYATDIIVYPSALMNKKGDNGWERDVRRLHKYVADCFPDATELSWLLHSCRACGFFLHFDLKRHVVTAKHINNFSKTVDFTPRRVRIENLLTQMNQLIEQVRKELDESSI